MKKITLFVLLSAATSLYSQSTTKPEEWRVLMTITNENGIPVPDADAWVAYASPKDGESTDPFAQNNWAIAGRTDTNGVFAAKGRDHSIYLGLHVRKQGYYPTWMQYELAIPGQYDLRKWNYSTGLVLKRVIAPIPMYAKWVTSQPPVNEKPVGYDLEAGDWVSPHGKGVKSDVLFTVHHERRAKNDFDYKLTVSFPNPGDGIQTFTTPVLPVREGSKLRSPHQAPETNYQLEWVKTLSQRPGQPTPYGLDKNLNVFFRVRTILDEKGNVKSANYGKIYGDFMDFKYYLNPTPNDRNVEFDPKKNLIKNAPSFEEVREP